MNSDPSQWIENFNRRALISGACAWGVSRAKSLAAPVIKGIEKWIQEGYHASMTYLERHVPLKNLPESVLPGCKSIISFAFPYSHDIKREPEALMISRHALSEDYHRVLKRQLKPLAQYISDTLGGKTRITVDSAPVAERYWAVNSGVGSIGRNGLLYVPGFGSWVFLAEILCTAELPTHRGNATGSIPAFCAECNRCVESCPEKAILDDNKIDCNKCRSYHTIENREKSLPPTMKLGKRIYGCDICQEVCPLNQSLIVNDSCLTPRKELMNLKISDLNELDVERYKNLVKGSSMERISLEQLKRNAGITG